jgi:hypothetical protein
MTRETVLEIVEREFACPCAAKELRRRVKSNGATAWVEQCLTCGRCSQEISAARIAPDVRSLAPVVDETIRETWEARRSEYWRQVAREQRVEAREEWLDAAAPYYHSAEWRTKRQRVIQRAQGRCEAGMRGCSGRADQVHHLSYTHFGNEPLWDLRAVCVSCHEQITDREREARGE